MAADEADVAVQLRKVANVLALSAIKDFSKGDAAKLLHSAGFSNKEISALTGSSEGSVRGFLSQAAKRAGPEG